MKTNQNIEYPMGPEGHIANIPAETPVIPASNLSNGGYWIEPWNGMTEEEESWQRTYGFHALDSEVD